MRKGYRIKGYHIIPKWFLPPNSDNGKVYLSARNLREAMQKMGDFIRVKQSGTGAAASGKIKASHLKPMFCTYIQPKGKINCSINDLLFLVRTLIFI